MKRGILMVIRPRNLIGLARWGSQEVIHPPNSVLGDFCLGEGNHIGIIFYEKVGYKLKYILELLYIILYKALAF